MISKPAFASRFWLFFLQPASLVPFVFLRVSFAVFSLCMCIALYPYLYSLHGNEGYMQWVITDGVFKKDWIPNLHDLYSWVNHFVAVTDVQVIRVAWLLYMFCLLCIAAGFFSNYMAAVAWLLHLLFLNTANIYGYGVETFTHILLFYFIFMPVDSSVSITSFIRKRRSTHPVKQRRRRVSARIFLRLLQLHLCIIYVNAGVAKMFGSQWYNGEAVWRSFTQFRFNTIDLTWMAFYPFIPVVAGWLVLITEALYPVFIWLPATRKWFLTAIIVMHFCIGFIMGLYFFSTIMVIMNLAAFGFTNNVEQTATNKNVQLPAAP